MGKRKVLTHYGRELFQIAKANQLQREKSLENLNRRYAAPAQLTLRVGCRKELFEALHERFRFPGKIEFTALSSAESVEQLRAQRIDVAIAYPPLIPDSTEFVAKKVLESVSQFVVPKKFLKKKLTEALLRDRSFLRETPCVIYQGGGHSVRDWSRHLGIPLDELKVAAVAEDWRALATLIESGWGYGILPGHVRTTNERTASLSIENAVLPKYSFYALFRKDLRKIPAFRGLLEFRN